MDFPTIFSALEAHVMEFEKVYDELLLLSSRALMEHAKIHLPTMVCTTANPEHKCCLAFVLRALASMLCIPVVLFKKHSAMFHVNVITPCLFWFFWITLQTT